MESRLLGACFKCATISWCTALCEVSATSYVLSDLLVTGGAQDTLPGDKLTCFTQRTTPGLFPAPTTVIADHSPPTSVERKAVNLLDGIYGLDIDECYFGETGSSSGDNPYIIFDFGYIRAVRQIVVRIQPSGSAYNKFHGVEVRLGNIRSSNSLLNYTIVASHFGTPIRNEEIVLEIQNLMEGRYFSIRQTLGYQLQFCHLEIFAA